MRRILLTTILGTLFTFALCSVAELSGCSAGPAVAGVGASADNAPSSGALFNKQLLDYVNEMRRDPKAFYRKYLPDYIASHPGRFTAQYTHSLKKAMLQASALSTFETSPALETCARHQYRYLARFGGHKLTHEQGSVSFADRMKQAGLHCLAENLYDADDPRALNVLLDLLIDEHVPSFGHRKNLLNPAYSHIGIISGTPKGGRTIVVMDFGCGR